MRKFWVLIFFLCLLPFCFWPQQKTFLVTKVVDGDTIEIEGGKTIRYIGVDAPELGKGKNPPECFATEAAKMNRDLVLGKRVKIETDVNEMDRFGRTLAYVYTEKVFVNDYLLKEGFAKFQLDTVNQKYIDLLISSANLAHREKKGLWKACAEDPSVGCVVKGNYDKHGHRFYHLPSFRHYSQVKVNLENGDQWFCSEEEAKKAGFQRAVE